MRSAAARLGVKMMARVSVPAAALNAIVIGTNATASAVGTATSAYRACAAATSAEVVRAHVRP